MGVLEMRKELEEIKSHMAAREDLQPQLPKCEALPARTMQQEVQNRSKPLWSLWSYINFAMHADRFGSEEEARAAFLQLRATGRPCVLRDPVGLELASMSWTTMPTRFLNTIRIV